MLFFSVAGRLILDLAPLNGYAEALLSGFLEFVTGTVKISMLDTSTARKLILTAVVVGFAGLSVHAQVMAVIAKYRLSLIPYITGKALHGLLAGLYMLIYLKLYPITSAVFEPSISRGFATASAFECVTAVSVICLCIAVAMGLYIREYKKGH